MSSPEDPTLNNATGSEAAAAAQLARIKEKYGGLPAPAARGLLKLKERKYFDSGDYALHQAGKMSAPVGSQHPQPENIPHSNPASANHGSPPVKESSLIHESETPEGAPPAVVVQHRAE
ncbi:hypothetical protein BGX34_007422 [Mortierella sp. NVP85]|nr:hypothetical protein BGX34_007422 [Mortierella sp. NVP85]